MNRAANGADSVIGRIDCDLRIRNGRIDYQTLHNRFVISSNVQGVQIELKYTGTIENKDSLKGKLSAGEFGDGTFT